MEYLPVLCAAAIIFLCYKLFSSKCENDKGFILSLNFSYGTIHFLIKNNKKMAATLTINQQVSGQVTPVDRKGNPAQVEKDSVRYTSSDDSVVIVVEDTDDETKFKVVATGVGTCQVTVSADADLGEGVEDISAFAAVEVFPEKAVGFGIAFGTPEDKPE